HDRHVDARPHLREALEALLRAHAPGECALGSEADRGALRERVREREAELDQVGAAVDRGLGELRRLGLAHEIDRERLHACASTSARSLSPRAERQTSTSSASRSSARASAWELSSAGMIPSVSARRWNAASASSSVHGRYSARPESRSAACSGPTPG